MLVVQVFQLRWAVWPESIPRRMDFMSYARLGNGDDIYFYGDRFVEVWCCGMCKLNKMNNVELTSFKEAIEHLQMHRAAGHKVPDHAFLRLEAEWDESIARKRLN